MSKNSRGDSLYGKANLKLMGILLSIWALVSFGFCTFLRRTIGGSTFPPQDLQSMVLALREPGEGVNG